MPRLSITLTESQAAALDRIAAATGATRQSMIGLAVTSWIRTNEHLAIVTDKEPENVSQEPERYITIDRDGVEVAWLRGRWENEERRAVIASAMRLSRDGELNELCGAKYRYELQEGEEVSIVDL